MAALDLKPLLLEDVKQMGTWRLHEDPWFYHYNFDCVTESDRLAWYKSKRVFLSRDIFGLFLENRLIGFITIKNYNWLKRTAEMGISMDLNYVNKGYGTEGLKLYLDYVFKHTFFKKIILRTACFNYRAVRSYEKVGFRFVKRVYMPYEEQRFASAIIERYGDIDVLDGQIYSDYYFMVIKKGMFGKSTNFNIK